MVVVLSVDNNYLKPFISGQVLLMGVKLVERSTKDLVLPQAMDPTLNPLNQLSLDHGRLVSSALNTLLIHKTKPKLLLLTALKVSKHAQIAYA